MIARVWHGYTNPENADAYETILKPELLPGLSRVKGFQGSYLLRRDAGTEVEFTTIMFWESLDSLCAIAGPDYQTAVVPEERRKLLLRYDAQAVHYEVVATNSLERQLTVPPEPSPE